MTDPAIVDLYWQRDDRAIAESEKKYGGYCHRIAYNICGSREDAEECVSDTWLRAWGLMPEARPLRLSPFFGAITRSLAINRSRAARRQKRGGGQTVLALEELSQCLPARESVEETAALHELSAALDRFLAALGDEDRALFLARYWFLTPLAELARRTGCGQGRLKTRLYRLRRRLRDFLEEEGLC